MKCEKCEKKTEAKKPKSPSLKGRVLKGASLVKMQKGTVVSREILKKKTGTVTLFAFDAGQGLSEHTAPYDALVVAIEGEVKITISGKSHRVKAGEMIIMPANDPHALLALAPFKMMLVMIRS